MHICLFGGAFDPPHVGHLQVAHSLLEKEICDEVWFVPVKQHPFGKEVQTNGHRVKMLELMLEPEMRVEEYELEHATKSYSFQTLEALSKQHPEHQISWVIGSDNLEKFHLWGDYQHLLEKYRVYVYPRKDFAFEPVREGMVCLENFPEVEVTSTRIRELLRQGKSVSGLVTKEVERYIRENELYR